MLPSSLLCAACFPIFSSPKHSFPNPYSAIHTSPFSFYILQPTFTVSLPLNFLSLLFPVKLAITSSFLSLSLFLVAWRWTLLPLLFISNEKSIGSSKVCQPLLWQSNTCYKETKFWLWPELLQIARFLFMDIGKLQVFHQSCSQEGLNHFGLNFQINKFCHLAWKTSLLL